MSPTLAALSPNLDHGPNPKKNEQSKKAAHRSDHVREFPSYQDDNGKLIVQSKQIKVVRNIQDSNIANQPKHALKHLKFLP